MKFPQKKIDLPPRLFTVLVTAGLLLLLFVTFSWLESSRTKSNFVSILEDEGFTLLDVLIASGERSILAYEETELLMQSRLLDNAYWIERLDFQRKISIPLLDEIASETSLYRILIFNNSGELILSSTSVHDAEDQKFSAVKNDIKEFLTQDSPDSLIIGFRQGRSPLQQRYAVVARRRRGGAIVVVGDAARLIKFRRELGPGRLIQEIGDQPGIEYVVLQDTVGIMLASSAVTSMSRIQSDFFLTGIYQTKSRGSRFYKWQNKNVFEIAGGFLVEENNFGLFRIGLETSHYRQILRNTRYRLVFIVLLYVLAGAAGISFFVSRQNLRLLSQAYKRVQTHTGEILQNLKDGVIAVDKTGKITVFNDAAASIFHISSSKAIGRQAVAINQSTFALIQESLETGRPVERIREKVVIRNRERILSLCTSILKNDQGLIDTVILVVTDLTEQQRLEDALHREEKQSAMGRLAAGVAHEIRNPVNAISMIAQRFLNEFKPTADREEFESLVKTMINESKRSEEIIRRFLEFARPAALNLEVASAKQLLGEVVNIMISSAEVKNVELKLAVINDARLHIDTSQIKQVFINLIQNSLEAISGKGCITITAQVEEKNYLITVADTGGGISPEHIDKIFDLYYTTRKEGLGMGLAIVYQIINRHNGSIEVTSRKGEETQFTITLPLKDK